MTIRHSLSPEAASHCHIIASAGTARLAVLGEKVTAGDAVQERGRSLPQSCCKQCNCKRHMRQWGERQIYTEEHTGQHNSNLIAVEFFSRYGSLREEGRKTINSFTGILQGAEQGSATEQRGAEVAKGRRRRGPRKRAASLTTAGQTHRSTANSRQWKRLRQPLKGLDSKSYDLHNRGSFTPFLPLSLSPAAYLLLEMIVIGLKSCSARRFLFCS